jgi:hypothetical protein
VFGPGTLGLLKDGADPDTLVDLDDITVVSTAGEVSFAMRLGQDLTVLATPIDFDIGLPALGLDVDGEVSVKLAWELAFGFGISRADGAFFDTNARDAAGNAVPELTVDLEVTTPGLDASGSLLLLQLDVVDDPDAPSRLGGRFTIDLRDPGNDDNRLSFAELASGPDFDDVIAASFTGAADVNLEAEVSFGGDAAFPRLLADFRLDWVFAGANPGTQANPFGNRPTVAFENIRMDFGSFLSGVLAPVVGAIDTVLEPIRPLLDVLDTELPVLSDLGPTRALLDRDGDGAVTLLEMAALLGDGFATAVTFLDAADNILDVKQVLDSLSTSGGSTLIDFGSFDFGSVDIRGRANLDGVAPNVTRAANAQAQFESTGTAAERDAV